LLVKARRFAHLRSRRMFALYFHGLGRRCAVVRNDRCGLSGWVRAVLGDLTRHPAARARGRGRRQGRAFRNSTGSWRNTFAGSTSVLLASLGLVADAAAQPQWKALFYDVGCANVTLVAAWGISDPAGSDHRYQFQGSCQIRQLGIPAAPTALSHLLAQLQSAATDRDAWFIGVPVKTIDAPFEVHEKATWSNGGLVQEELDFSGAVQGKAVLLLTDCGTDPFLKGGGPCGSVSAANPHAGSPHTVVDISGVAAASLLRGLLVERHVPLFWRQTDVATAKLAEGQHQKLAGLDNGPKPTQTPPADRSKTVVGANGVEKPPSGIVNAEGESLALAHRYVATAGQVGAQSMQRFGTGWSNDAQLFWGGGAVGATLDLTIDVPARAAYAVEIYFTRGPDFGRVQTQVDGRPVGPRYDGYGPKVMAAGPMQAGKFSLEAGPRKVSFLILGKNDQSSGYAVGIDRIRLYRVGDY
jgi:hypothetical protein